MAHKADIQIGCFLPPLIASDLIESQAVPNALHGLPLPLTPLLARFGGVWLKAAQTGHTENHAASDRQNGRIEPVFTAFFLY